MIKYMYETVKEPILKSIKKVKHCMQGYDEVEESHVIVMKALISTFFF